MGKERLLQSLFREESLLSPSPQRSEDYINEAPGVQGNGRAFATADGDTPRETPEGVPRGILQALRRKIKDKSSDGEGGGPASKLQRAQSLGLPIRSKRHTSAQPPPRLDVLNSFMSTSVSHGMPSTQELPYSAASTSKIEGMDDLSNDEGHSGRKGRGFTWRNPFSTLSDAANQPVGQSGPEDAPSNGFTAASGRYSPHSCSEVSCHNSLEYARTSQGDSQSSSMTATPVGTPVLLPLGLFESQGPGAASEKQKVHHHRGRSLSSVFNPLKLKVRRSSAAGDDSFEGQVKLGPSEPAPKVLSRGSCFGMGPNDTDESDSSVAVGTSDSLENDREVPFPAGLVGLRNIGNTCFVNAAVQCLRHTPDLPLALLPDLFSTRPSGTADASESQHGSRVPSRANSLQDLSLRGENQTGDAAVATIDDSSGNMRVPTIIGVVADSNKEVSALVPPAVESLPTTPEHALLVSNQGSPSNACSPASYDTMFAVTQHSSPAAAASSFHSPADLPSIPAKAQLSPYECIKLREAEVRRSPPAQPTAAAVPAAASMWSEAARISPTNEGEPCNCNSVTVDTGSSSQEPTRQPQAASGGTIAGNSSPSGQGDISAETARGQSAPAVAPSPPLKKGELLELFRQLVRELYQQRQVGRRAVDPAFLVRRLGPLGAPLGEDFTDGRQHDGEEVLSAIVDRLHQDLNRVAVSEEDECDGSVTPSQPVEELWSTPTFAAAAASRSATEALFSQMSSGSASRMGHHRLAMADVAQRNSLVLDKDGGYQLMPHSPYGDAISPRLSLQRDSYQHSSFQQSSLARVTADGILENEQPAAQSTKQLDVDPNETETAKGDRLWALGLEEDDSLVTDMFGGQLQGNVVCHGCKQRFTRYEFFKGLCLPLASEARSGLSSWFSSRPPPASITDCLNVFTAGETLSGKDKEEYYQCDVCKAKKAATIYTRINRFPRVLILHTKRFVYSGATGVEKVTTNVAFPLRGLKLGAYGSEEVTSAAGWTQPATKDRDRDASAAAAGPVYDLYAVINHFGSYTAGHYTATCRAPGAKETWHTFNDEIVTRITPSQVATANAYILFYVRRHC